MNRKFTKYAGALLCLVLIQCTPDKETKASSITLDAPEKGYWFLSEKFPYQFIRIELYKNHIEGLPSLTMEFRVKAESKDATWETDASTVRLSFKKPTAGNVSLTPVYDNTHYKGRYTKEKLLLPLMEVKLGSERRIMHYTESDAEMDRLLREKNKLKLDVVWGPTQKEVIDAMFRFTHPTRNDVIFDLGCGDARILIAAAQRFGAHGVGYDLDPKLIEKGWSDAKRARVDQLLTLKTENLFAADLSSATIVAIYLSDRINAKLKPKFFRELSPGTRLVSHNWHMGDWQFDGKEVMEDKTRVVYFWVMPANFSGTWKDETGATFKIDQHYQFIDIESARNSQKPLKSLRVRGLFTASTPLGVATLDGNNLRWQKKGTPDVLWIREKDSAVPFSL
ncbi:MAG TPA: 50S ribosomal protein L11 methyltransferase [Turneriella sp.]|nr:50S ribosomal protein L11 methyltransferase [Turneriella sp.]